MIRRFRTAIGGTVLILVLVCVTLLTLIEYRLEPLVLEGARSRARLYAARMLAESVESVIDPDEKLITVNQDSDGVSSIETNILAVSRLRTSAVKAAAERLSDIESMSLDIPIGSLLGGRLFVGRGFDISLKLEPIGDVRAELYSEFLETGINQTLHRIYLRMTAAVRLFVASEVVRLELTDELLVAETVIVGKVPDAYTAINRFEIDENEENDLNDYAASIP